MWAQALRKKKKEEEEEEEEEEEAIIKSSQHHCVSHFLSCECLVIVGMSSSHWLDSVSLHDA